MKKYLCNNCGIVEGKVIFDDDLDCDLCEDCTEEDIKDTENLLRHEIEQIKGE